MLLPFIQYKNIIYRAAIFHAKCFIYTQLPCLQYEMVIYTAVVPKAKLELMLMKHYAPNRCLYIKVAKLRTGVGSAKTSYLQNCSVKLFKEHFKVQIFKGR